MSKQSFPELGVSPPVVGALAAREIHSPFPIQERVLPDALAGLDVLVRSPTGSGKTLAFALPIVERTMPSDSRPSALVLVPTRELAAQVCGELDAARPGEGPRRSPSPTAACPLRAQAKRAQKAHDPDRHARPPRGPRRAPADRSGRDPHVRPRRGRPDARHGLQAPGRPDRPPPAAEPPDDVLLGDARRRSGPSRARVHEQPVALRERDLHTTSRPRSSTASWR